MFRFGEPTSGVLDATRKVGKHTLTLRARNMKLTRDGYARCLLALLVGSVPIHSTIVEIDDDDDRHKFALKLYGTKMTEAKLGADITSEFPQRDFEQEFMAWARTAWNAYIGSSSGSDLAGDEEPSAPPWDVPGLIMAGSTNIAAGDAGSGKSTLYRFAAQSLRYGLNKIIPIRSEGFPIWVNAEESPEEHTRQLGNVNAALGLPRNAPMFTIHARGMRIEDLSTRLERAVRETGAKHIFIDSLSRLAQGMSLNDNNTATLLVDSVAGFGCSVNWIGHTGWQNRERLAGSRHFENAARVMVLVQSRMATSGVSADLYRGVRTRVTKANGAIETVPMYWSLEYHRQFGLLRASRADEQDWPTLVCTFSGEGKPCTRRTWDGVMPDGEVRCVRHRGEEAEP